MILVRHPRRMQVNIGSRSGGFRKRCVDKNRKPPVVLHSTVLWRDHLGGAHGGGDGSGAWKRCAGTGGDETAASTTHRAVSRTEGVAIHQPHHRQR